MSTPLDNADQRRTLIQSLTELWNEVVTKDHHKDRDCHWVIEMCWSYGKPPEFMVVHNGYVHREVRVPCTTLDEAERRLVQELVKALQEEFDAAAQSDFDDDACRLAIRQLQSQFTILAAQAALAPATCA